jgi:hypothetical protein
MRTRPVIVRVQRGNQCDGKTLMVVYESFRVSAGRPILNGSAAVQLYYVSYLTMLFSASPLQWLNRLMTENALVWGKIGWIVALAVIGLAIWYFRVYRKPPHSN